MNQTKTLFIIPPGKDELKGRILEPTMRSPGAPLSGGFVDFFEENGFAVKTIDAWKLAEHKLDDALLVINFPDDSLFMRALYFFKYTLRGKERFAVNRKDFYGFIKLFSKKILYQGEPPSNMPYPHRHLQKLSKLFDTIFLFRKAETKNSKVRHLMWPRDLREGFERLHEVPKERFLAMINNNCTPHGDFKRELYSERLRAIKYFSSKEGFDLWGGRWDRLLFFPHWNKFGAVKKSWRGYIEGDKLEMLAKYKFAIAFENSSYPGYVSEKIFDCFLTGVVPVYLGAPDVTEYVPKDCFIDMREFKTYADLEKYLRAVPDRELVLYRERFIKYLYSVKDTIFSKRLFAEKIWNALG